MKNPGWNKNWRDVVITQWAGMRLPKDILLNYILHDLGVMTLYHFVKSG